MSGTLKTESARVPAGEPSCESEGDTGKSTACRLELSAYHQGNYTAGRNDLVCYLWYCVSLLMFENGWFPVSCLKTWLLRRFGARIGQGVVIKTHVRIKFPWRLFVDDTCWIGEGVWIDNLADVTLERNVCISQGAYLCTGGHDYRRRTFDLIAREIRIEQGVWIGARALILPGWTVHANSVVAAGSVVARDVSPGCIAMGNPATEQPIR